MAQKRLPPFARELIIFAVLVILLWRVASIHAAPSPVQLPGQPAERSLRHLADGRSDFAGIHRGCLDHRSRHWNALFGSYTRAMRWAAYATASLLIGLLADRDSDPHPVVTALCAASLLMSAAVLARMLWITERVVRVVITPGTRRPGEV